MDLSKNARSDPAGDPSKKISSAFIEELGRLIGSFLEERERKRQTAGEAKGAFSVDQTNPSNPDGSKE